jgi:hypothetical protein
MTRRTRSLVPALVLLALVSSSTCAEGFVRSIGVRLTLPWGGRPILAGAEATADLGFGLGTGSFFLSSKGEGMLVVGVAVPLSEGMPETMAYARLLAGFYYFDLSAFAPSLLAGIGMGFETDMLDPVLVGLAIDFAYPIAFPLPLVSASFGWSLP